MSTLTQQHYRNVILKNFIDSYPLDQQDSMWDIVRFIRKEWPETDKCLKGEIIFEETQKL